MSAPVITSVVPPLLPHSGGRFAAGLAPVRGSLPLPSLISGRTSRLVYGLAAVDDRGRVADRVVMRALGWSAGLCLAIDETGGVLTVHTDPHGDYQVTGQGNLRLPAALRHRCGLAAGIGCSWSPIRVGPGWPSIRPPRWTTPSPSTSTRRAVSPHDDPAIGSQYRRGRRARLLLARLGVSPADLMAVTEDRVPAPTFAEYILVVRAAVTDGTRRVYGSYWNRIVEQWGDRRLDEPTPSEIQQLAEHVKANVVARRNARGERSAAEHLIAALRCIYRHAENDGHISAADNFGYAIARAYAGHTDSGNTGTTATYVRASLAEIATALAALTAEPHPLALGESRHRSGSDTR